MPSKYNTSLRKQTLAKIAKDHSDLMSSKLNFVKAYLNYLSQKDKWWLVLFHVLALFFIFAFFRFNFLSFVHFDDKTAAILIDQRTSNVATIISMTLAVISLLLGNLAIKDNHTYQLLFVNSKLYLILYYTLSVICCLIIISTLRDTLPKHIFERLVLAGTYMAIFILFGIGYLFRTIIRFSNSSTIQTILADNLLMEARENLRIYLLSKYSLESFLNLMKQKEISIKQTQLENLPNQNVQAQERLIYDINLSKLSIELEKDKTDRPKYFNTAMSLNMITKSYAKFIHFNSDEYSVQKLNLLSCITTKTPSKLVNQSQFYKSYFADKLVEYSAEGKKSKVSEILSVYRKVFELQMKHS